jgi:hypothetical protein
MGDEGRRRALEYFACREIAARVVSDTADLPD